MDWPKWQERYDASPELAARLQLVQTPKQPVSQVPLKSLHPDSSLSRAKLAQFDKLPDPALIDSLKPGRPGSLKVRPNGTILDGHHRIKILRDRRVDVDSLPREIIRKN